jgi:hypothetical protein
MSYYNQTEKEQLLSTIKTLKEKLSNIDANYMKLNSKIVLAFGEGDTIVCDNVGDIEWTPQAPAEEV